MPDQRAAVPESFDAAGFADFYTYWHRRLLAFLRHIGAEDDTEDVCHDVLVRVWLADVEFDDHEEARPYLFQAAKNRLYDIWRHNRYTVVAPTEVVEPRLGVAPTPEDIAVGGVRTAALVQAWQVLAPPERALLAAAAEEVPIGVLAHRAGCNEVALRQKLWRARTKLRTELGPDFTPIPVVLLYRRAMHAARTTWRNVAESVTTLCTQPHPIAVVLTALTMVAVPFNGPITAPAYADDVQRGAHPPFLVAGPRLPSPPDGADGHDTTARHGARTSPVLAPRGARLAPPSTMGDPPKVCLGGHCPSGSPGDQDVITVHLPAPIGDSSFGTDLAPVCATVPDTPVTSCHTDGDPDYRVVPPRHRRPSIT